MNENILVNNQTLGTDDPQYKSHGFIGDLKYFANVRKIIGGNRSFFFDFYFMNYLPATIQSLSASGEWMKKLDCINEAIATKNNLLESIDEAIALAQESIKTQFVKKMTVNALRRESTRYSEINVVAASYC